MAYAGAILEVQTYTSRLPFNLSNRSPPALLATPFSNPEMRVTPQLSAVESPPFPFESTAVERLRGSLLQAVRKHEATLAGLRMAVEDCVRHLRAAGMTPEAMLVTMKAFIRHTAVAQATSGGTRQATKAGDVPTWLSDPLMERIVGWCIAEYFHEDTTSIE